jgi:hypothetical protein
MRIMVPSPMAGIASRQEQAFWDTPQRPKTRKKCCAKTTIFLSNLNLISPVQPSAQKYSSSVFQKSMFLSAHPVSIRGAARDRHGRGRRDAVDVRVLSAF